MEKINLWKKFLSVFEQDNESDLEVKTKPLDYLKATRDLSRRPYQVSKNKEYWSEVFQDLMEQTAESEAVPRNTAESQSMEAQIAVTLAENRAEAAGDAESALRGALDLTRRPYQNQENMEWWGRLFRTIPIFMKEQAVGFANLLSRMGAPITSGGDFGDLTLEEVTAANLMMAPAIGGKTKMKIPTRKDVAVAEFSRLPEIYQKAAKKAAIEGGLSDEVINVLKGHSEKLVSEAQRYPAEYWDLIRKAGYDEMELGEAYVSVPETDFKVIKVPRENIDKLKMPESAFKAMSKLVDRVDDKNVYFKTPIPQSQLMEMRFNQRPMVFDPITEEFFTPITPKIPEIMRHEFGHVWRDDRMLGSREGRALSKHANETIPYERRPHEIQAFEAGASIPEGEPRRLSAKYLDEQYQRAENKIPLIQKTMDLQDELVDQYLTRAMENGPGSVAELEGTYRKALRDLDKGLPKGHGRAHELEKYIDEIAMLNKPPEWLQDIGSNTLDADDILGALDPDGDIPFYKDIPSKKQLESLENRFEKQLDKLKNLEKKKNHLEAKLKVNDVLDAQFEKGKIEYHDTMNSIAKALDFIVRNKPKAALLGAAGAAEAGVQFYAGTRPVPKNPFLIGLESRTKDNLTDHEIMRLLEKR